jgi:hypothetical protein
VKTRTIKTAAAIIGMAAGLAAVAPVSAMADTTTTNPAVTAPPVQGTGARHVALNVDTVTGMFHGAVPAGAVQGACAVTHHFMQGQTVVFRMWGTAADGTPLVGPNATDGGNVASAVVTIQLPGGGTQSIPMSYASHPSGASYWTGAWATSASTPTGTVNYTVSVTTNAVNAVVTTVPQTTYTITYKKVHKKVWVKINGHRHAVKVTIRKAYKTAVTKQVQQVVTPAIPGETATYSSSALPDLPDTALTIVSSGTAPTGW